MDNTLLHTALVHHRHSHPDLLLAPKPKVTVWQRYHFCSIGRAIIQCLKKGMTVIAGGFGDEWTEWHLTPRGWLRGTRYIGGRPGTNTLRPTDRVMTARYHELLTADRYTTFVEVAWLGTDADAIAALLSQYGPCPERL